MDPLRAFTEHPASVGESYFGHLLQASRFGLRMIGAGLACLVHGLLPFLCVTRGSDAMTTLHAEMAARRAKACGDAAASVDRGTPVRSGAGIR
ncbi:MAG: DUF6356 family protein [Gammaproteobacteria bacterium]